jgi:hypothetical protein
MRKIVPGAEIPSPNVQAQRQYVDGREIKNLAAVGAITPTEREILERADELRDGGNKDGKVQIDELVQLERPEYARGLFPEEQELQPGLWRTLEWEPVARTSPGPELPKLEKLVADRSVLPDPLALNRAFDITEKLPEALQRTAARAKRVLQGGEDAISVADVEVCLQRPGPLNEDEVRGLGKIRELLMLELGGGELRAQIAVPAPGEMRLRLPCASPVKVESVSKTSLEEVRRYAAYQRVFGEALGALEVEFTLRRQVDVQLEVPAGHQALLISLENRSEYLAEEGSRRFLGDGGRYRLELWKEGRRVSNAEVQLPSRSDDRVDLSRYAGYRLVAADGRPLHRQVHRVNLNERIWAQNGRVSVRGVKEESQWSLEPPNGDAPMPAGIPQAQHGLATGRYRIGAQGQQLVLNAFPEGVLTAQVGEAVIHFSPTPSLNGWTYRATGVDAQDAQIAPQIPLEYDSHSQVLATAGAAPRVRVELKDRFA